MTKMEKVIKGTEICLSGGAPDRCRECPYDREGCDRQRMQDTLELLKAQEPRVMMLDEAAAADEVWIEERLSVSIMVAILYITDDFKNFELELLGTSKKALMLAKDYGHTWRCWSAKPTEDQRLAVKWE